MRRYEDFHSDSKGLREDMTKPVQRVRKHETDHTCCSRPKIPEPHRHDEARGRGDKRPSVSDNVRLTRRLDDASPEGEETNDRR